MERANRMRKDYTKEFKAEAVRLVQSGERKQAEVARNLGLGTSTISKWCREAVAATEEPGVCNKDLVAENKRLEAEVRRLKLEQDILKKAAAYFARNQM